MNTKEELQNYFITKKLQIVIHSDNSKREFLNVDHFYEFIQNEYTFWKPCSQGEVSRIANYFKGILAQLDKAFGRGVQLEVAKRHLDYACNTLKESYPAVYSFTPVGKFIKERYEETPQQASAVCDFIFSKTINRNSLNQIEYFKGVLHAFNLGNLEVASTKAQELENSSLMDLRDTYTKELNTLHSDYLQRSNQIYNDHEDFKGIIQKWKKNIQDGTESFVEDKRQKLDQLEKTYNEKLRLESPAKYWKELSEEYNDKGHLWRMWTLISSVLFILFLAFLLYSLPEKLFPITNKFDLTTLKGTIIFGLIASIGVYVIRLFVKLSISAYHLARDANERYQLTYVYLSLLNEKGITESERSIVLQAIFSRADTGLLKGDSTPTLPDGGNIANFQEYKNLISIEGISMMICLYIIRAYTSCNKAYTTFPPLSFRERRIRHLC